MCSQYSAPPTHRTDSLAHRQSEYPMAQMADSQPPQTSHVESDQTMLERLRKLLTQLNTPNILVADLVRVSPNASDVQRLGRCVPAFTTMATADAGDPKTELEPPPPSLKSAVCKSLRFPVSYVDNVRVVDKKDTVFKLYVLTIFFHLQHD